MNAATGAVDVLAWGRGEDAEFPGASIAELFEAVAARQPDASALIFRGHAVPYAELRREALSVAANLIASGVSTDERIALFLHRGPQLVTSLLGVLMAGAAYVPLDLTWPPGHLALALEAARARMVITERALVARVHELGWPTCAVEDLAARSGRRSSATFPANLAYVMLTSGSTGSPKAVGVSHASVVNLVHQIARAYALGSGCRMLGLASVGFDVSVFEVFGSLLTGGTLCLADEEERRSPPDLERLLEDLEVEVAELPPALMPYLDPERLPALRLVSVGGEPPSADLVNRWWTPGRRFVNGYGPTETTVVVTLMECAAPTVTAPPIGRPMANHRAVLTDTELRDVGVAAAGELCIGGPGLARGYLDDPALTAERFVPDPFSDRPGSRLYRTGDRARWLSDGSLVFLGRMDRQAKVRGHRVDLDGVEVALSAQPAIRASAVIVDSGGDTLVAFLAADGALDLQALRGRLAATLPPAMVPARFVILDRLPTTVAGKVDRRALSEMAT